MRKVVQRRIRHQGDGVDVVADVNAVIATNTADTGAEAATSKRQRLRIVQRRGRTEVSENSDRD